MIVGGLLEDRTQGKGLTDRLQPASCQEPEKLFFPNPRPRPDQQQPRDGLAQRPINLSTRPRRKRKGPPNQRRKHHRAPPPPANSMKLNEDIALLSSKILLVPYDPHHVPTYHQWMEDPHLREATASEGLSIEDEYGMQRTWRADNDKLTFITVIPPPAGNEATKTSIIAGVDDHPSRMIGDVNLFFANGDDMEEDDDEEEDEEEEEGSTGEGDDRSSSDAPPSRASPRSTSSSQDTQSPRRITGEVEIMIARSQYQGSGLGKATLLLFLAYVLRNRDAIVEGICKEGERATLSSLRAKINQNNVRSMRLFEGIGFRKRGTPNYFGEYELLVDISMEEYQHHVDGLLEDHGMGAWEELKYERPSSNGWPVGLPNGLPNGV